MLITICCNIIENPTIYFILNIINNGINKKGIKRNG